MTLLGLLLALCVVGFIITCVGGLLHNEKIMSIGLVVCIVFGWVTLSFGYLWNF